MRKKGAVETFATSLIIIVSLIVFMITLYMVFNYFLSFSMTVSLHEMDRKMNDYAENTVTNCSLLYSPGVFDSSLLDSAVQEDPLKEYCYRYCEYGIGIAITDYETDETWKLGYFGENNINMRTLTFKTGVFREASGEDGSDDFTETTTTTVIQCPEKQENCESHATREECERSCCAWYSSCKSCESLSFNGCNYANYYQGVCSLDSDGSRCIYLQVPRKRDEIKRMTHPGTVTISFYNDLLTRVSCEAEKAGISGTRKMLLEESNLPLSVEDRKISIYGLGDSICMEMPSISSGYLGDFGEGYYTRMKFCRKAYSLPVVTDGTLEFLLNEDMNLTFSKSGDRVIMGAEKEEGIVIECPSLCGSDVSYAAGSGCGKGCSCCFSSECSSGTCRVFGEQCGRCE